MSLCVSLSHLGALMSSTLHPNTLFEKLLGALSIVLEKVSKPNGKDGQVPGELAPAAHRETSARPERTSEKELQDIEVDLFGPDAHENATPKAVKVSAQSESQENNALVMCVCAH
ncbi:hypothetical protein OUZ56_000365 [Daphnia magna]|uniref:Uncharacterized protein n=1 Tax=Daphnia magna TaxID=35525 RepID=A0ABQ9ZZG5_9CRUS|nr:hypothetical protein OUZ56_000365 [Daphnia magna]